MARIRSVFPGLFTDDSFVKVSPTARILLIGIWTECFDDGVFVWNALKLKMKLFPADNIDVEPLLEELAAVDSIKRIEVEGRSYGLVRNFCRYQKPKKPNSSEVLPKSEWFYVCFKPKSSDNSEIGPEPITDEYGTDGEITLLREEGGGRRESTSEQSSGAPRAGSLVEDSKQILFSAGAQQWAEWSKKSEADSRTIIGRMLRDLGGDGHASLLLGMIRDTAKEGKSRGDQWVLKMVANSVRARSSPTPIASGPPVDIRTGKKWA